LSGDTFVRRIPWHVAFVPLVLVAACMLATNAAAVALSGQDISIAGDQADVQWTFAIPPQPLVTALNAYSETTGEAVLVDASLTAGRQSPGLTGRFNKMEALQKLLAGTGLVATYSTDQAFTVKRAEPVATSSAPTQPSESGSSVENNETAVRRYASEIQQPIEAALCQSELTRPGNYRLLLQFWIAPSGKIERARMMGIDDTARMNDIRQALTSLTLPPPGNMPQPLTLLILPRQADDAGDCTSHTGRRS
jgi:hypothetical protein